MEYNTRLKVYGQGETAYGLPVREMIASGARIQADGKVKARFHYVQGYVGFSSTPAEQEGYYFPVHITNTGKKVTCKKNGVVTKDNIEFDPDWVLRVDESEVFEFIVDGESIGTLDFSEAVFEEKKGDGKMLTKLFDEGICGVAQYAIIGVLDENTKENEEIVFKNAIPKGFRLVHGFTNPSADLEGGGKINVGCPGNDTYYVNQLELATYKGKGCGGEYPYNLREVPSADVTAKIDTKITAGKVELAVEIVKLEV